MIKNDLSVIDVDEIIKMGEGAVTLKLLHPILFDYLHYSVVVII